jgi:arylsulfatase
MRIKTTTILAAAIRPLKSLALAALAIVPTTLPAQAAEAGRKPPRPNIITIMCDDAGFADFGFTGGVAKTPVLDRLAAEGVLFTRAYNNGRCMPTRQSLQTGLNPQLAHDWDRLGENCVTLAEVLNSAGYDNYMIGKWHLGKLRLQEGKAPPSTPINRGYKSFFGCIDGAVEVNKKNLAKHIEDFKKEGKEDYIMMLYDGNRVLDISEVPDDYYGTFDWSDRGADIIRKQPKDKPFFLFMSYTAPHWNLDPLPEYIAKYDGMFDRDWEEMRQEILDRQISKGIMPEGTPLMPMPERVKQLLEEEKKSPWNRDARIRDTQIHYASITEMDEGIGRLIEALKETGRDRETLLLFLSDNGGEPGRIDRAMVSNTPLGGFKVSSWEGGLATPLIAWWPGTVPGGKLNTGHEVHLEDFMPTFLDLSGAQYPKEFEGRPIYAHQGRSFVKAMKDPDYSGPHRVWAWEHDGSNGVWSYPWKAVYVSPEQGYFVRSGAYNPDQVGWRLFKLDKHRVEKDDLSASNPKKLQEMIALWKEWAKSVGVRAHYGGRRAGLPPEHEDAPRPDPKTWDPAAGPAGRPVKPE